VFPPRSVEDHDIVVDEIIGVARTESYI